jgi:hypothetical protein
VGNERLVLPLDDVARVVEVDVDVPPPLSSSWVSGLGMLDGHVALAVTLFPGARRRARDRILGVELRSAPGEGALRWIIEITRVLAPVRGNPTAPAAAGPRWLLEGDDDRSWLDVSTMRAALGGKAK